MHQENFLIQFLPSKNCFLQFSNKWFQKLNSSKCSCVRLVHPETKHDLYLSWAPQPSYALNDCSVGINATFAQTLGLQEGELVIISSEERLPSLRQVFLTPVSPDDYEILEMCRDSVEVLVLNQIRVVYVSQVISIWVSKTMYLKLSVDRLESNLSYGRLEQMTELFIENVSKIERNKSYPKLNTSSDNLNNNVPSSQQNHKNGPSLLWDKLSEYLPSSLVDLLKPSESLEDPDVVTYQSDYSQMLCRVHSFPNVNEQTNCCLGAHSEDVHPFNVFVHRRTLQKENCWAQDSFVSTLLDGQQSVVLCRLKAVPKRKSRSPNSKSSDDKSKDNSSEIDDTVSVCVRLYLIEDSCSFFSRTRTNVSCVFLSRFVRKLLHLDVGSKVLLTAYHPPIDKVLTEVKLVPATTLDETEVQILLRHFEERVSDRRGILVNNYCPLPVAPASSPVLVLLSPPQLECWPLTHSDLQVCLVTVAEEAERSLESFRVDDKDTSDIPQRTSVFEQLVKEGITTLEYGLRLVEDQNQEMILDNILITGKQGSGKSRLAEAIYTAVSAPPRHIYVSVVDCKSLKGKKPESIGKIVAEQLAECVYYQPAVLVLEDLDCIAGVPTQDMESTQESRYFLRLATVLKELLWTLRVGQSVGVVATAQSRAQVHPQLLSARGRHIFTTCLHIPALEKDDRLCILEEMLKEKLPFTQLPELDDLADKTKGCVAQDLYKLVDRIVFKSSQRRTQAELRVNESDLGAAYEGFVPGDLLNLSMVRLSSHSFTSVGGLQSIKQLLTEVLIWPTKYPEVFSQCPLRLERGVLLYGAPGTGKTLLANAIAGESGLNFITVKGPELLSKYIGASEEAVRNVFQKAQSAQPCILFFDEFDSLAPRRGHDSTGVTDRVVNQLLTQMDGVEMLEGVWVLAAASRPDLLDPALLRPGRICTLLHCPLPNQEDRLAILTSLSGKLRMSEDVDLAKVADLTEGFTGADLQALLFTAQMSAYDSLYQDSDDDVQVVKFPVQTVVVGQADLLAALEDTKPSLKPEDRIRFNQIYERFEKNRESKGRGPPEESTQRVTLA